ncbi:MAG: TetR/AcrR family transcriptional regulator [Burkholderiales bacterium]|nr:MAG: TetR/AcrR family transcriptional regulator [Burkholderiales bacterium]
MRVKKKAGYHHGDLRQTLIDVSVDVIDREGLEALSLRALATRAGVSSGAPYHHFADRAALLSAIALEGFERLEQAMIDRRDAAPADPVSRLDAIGQAYVGFAVTNTGHFRVMFRDNSPAARSPALSAASQKAYRLLYGVVEECQAVAAAPAGDPGPLVYAAWSLVHGLATLWVDGALPTARVDPAALAPRITGLLGRMLVALAREEGAAQA